MEHPSDKQLEIADYFSQRVREDYQLYAQQFMTDTLKYLDDAESAIVPVSVLEEMKHTSFGQL